MLSPATLTASGRRACLVRRHEFGDDDRLETARVSDAARCALPPRELAAPHHQGVLQVHPRSAWRLRRSAAGDLYLRDHRHAGKHSIDANCSYAYSADRSGGCTLFVVRCIWCDTCNMHARMLHVACCICYTQALRTGAADQSFGDLSDGIFTLFLVG